MTENTVGRASNVIAELGAMRRNYARAGLAEKDLAPSWFGQFGAWLADATAAGLPEPNAMILATADGAGRPSARTMLLKGVDEHGFVCYTNYESRKARDVAANPNASLVFPWFAMGRQVIVCGAVHRVDRGQTEAYFATRPRPAQIGAWASPQSQVIDGRPVLDAAQAEVERRFGDGPVPAPAHWGGLRIVPESVEFWQGREGRLHDRLRYRQASDDISAAVWVIERLAP